MLGENLRVAIRLDCDNPPSLKFYLRILLRLVFRCIPELEKVLADSETQMREYADRRLGDLKTLFIRFV